MRCCWETEGGSRTLLQQLIWIPPDGGKRAVDLGQPNVMQRITSKKS